MSKKIVAIGGGKKGKLKENNTYYPYETEPMDREIIRLTGKKHPNFLFLAHSKPLEKQEDCFIIMKHIYSDKYNCECRDIKSNELNDIERIKALIDWADIIYEYGGNTLTMIDLWRKSGFDKLLKAAYESGKVMCGTSAGANCWFEECSSDSLKIMNGDDQPFIRVKCLGFIKGFLVPHCDEHGRYETAKRMLKENNMVGIMLSNCAAIEIVDDKYRIIVSDGKRYNIKPYALKAYWKDGKYYEERLNASEQYKTL